MRRWQLQEAKARFSDVVKATESEGPQEITVRGKVAVVILSRADFERLRGRKGTLVDFMQESPLAGVELDLERDRSSARKVRL